MYQFFFCRSYPQAEHPKKRHPRVDFENNFMKLQQEKHRIELEQMNEIHQAKLHILDLERQLADEKLRKFRTSIYEQESTSQHEDYYTYTNL